MKKVVLFIFILVFGVLQPQFAQTDSVNVIHSTEEGPLEIITNRPGATEASRAVYKGGFQMEMGLEYGKIPNWRGSTENVEYLFLPHIGIQYGVSDNVELRLFTINLGQRANTNSGVTKYVFNVNEVFAGSKINVLNSKGWIPELAFLVTQGIPTTFDNVTKRWPTLFLAAWSYSLPQNFSLSGNVGYINGKEYYQQQISFNHGFVYTMNLGYSFRQNAGMFVELFGLEESDSDRGLPVNIDGGLWYRFNPKFQIDASVGYGFEVSNYYFNIGMSLLILNE